MITQRVFSLTVWQKKLNNHNQTRYYLLIKTAVSSDKVLASAPTLSRFERTIDRKKNIWIHSLLIKTFTNSFKKVPKEIILDFDGTKNKAYGNINRSNI